MFLVLTSCCTELKFPRELRALDLLKSPTVALMCVTQFPSLKFTQTLLPACRSVLAIAAVLFLTHIFTVTRQFFFVCFFYFLKLLFKIHKVGEIKAIVSVQRKSRTGHKKRFRQLDTCSGGKDA